MHRQGVEVFGEMGRIRSRGTLLVTSPILHLKLPQGRHPLEERGYCEIRDWQSGCLGFLTLAFVTLVIFACLSAVPGSCFSGVLDLFLLLGQQLCHRHPLISPPLDSSGNPACAPASAPLPPSPQSLVFVSTYICTFSIRNKCMYFPPPVFVSTHGSSFRLNRNTIPPWTGF